MSNPWMPIVARFGVPPADGLGRGGSASRCGSGSRAGVGQEAGADSTGARAAGLCREGAGTAEVGRGSTAGGLKLGGFIVSRFGNGFSRGGSLPTGPISHGGNGALPREFGRGASLPGSSPGAWAAGGGGVGGAVGRRCGSASPSPCGKTGRFNVPIAWAPHSGQRNRSASKLAPHREQFCDIDDPRTRRWRVNRPRPAPALP